MNKLKKGIATIAIAASGGGTAIVAHDQLHEREYVKWVMAGDGPKIIDNFKSNKFQVSSLNINPAYHVEENVIYQSLEYDPNLAAKLLEAAKAFIMKLSAADLSCAPKPTPTPVPIPDPTPIPTPVGTEINDWGFTRVKADEANSTLKSTNKIIVAVLDTGIDLTHPDLPRPSKAVDFTGGNNPQDFFSHGTHVAGTIAAVWGNSVGVKGIVGKNVDLIVGKVLGNNGSGNLDWIANGITWACQSGAKVLNLSLGSPSDSQLLRQAIAYCTSRGAQVVMANGNDSGPVNYPAKYADGVNSFAISATGTNNLITAFSSRGPETSYAAPGAAIISTVTRSCPICSPTRKDPYYSEMSGTSMATPHVVAVCALHLLSGKPNCSNLGVSVTGDRNLYGKGIVDALKSVSP